MKICILVTTVLLLLDTSFVDCRIRHYDDEASEFVIIPEDGSPCERPCTLDSEPMICHYRFVVEWYRTLSKACYDCPTNKTDCFRPHCIPADGTDRSIVVVNRKMPGTGIQVCYGDEIIVDVENHLEYEETSIHWHGHHQRKNPYMDGVPHVTQCPISSGTTFRYEFDAVHPGTNFWHSHSGTQRGDGVYGPLVTRLPRELDRHADIYDFDLASHVLMITDWFRDTTQPLYAGTVHSDTDAYVNSLLVNGLGYFIGSTTIGEIPPARFTVKKDYKYRFRVINTEFLICPIALSVDNHTITVISMDGYDIEPVTVDSLVTYSGERFDFIINSDQKIGHYWMRFRGLMMCGNDKAHQVAVLTYEGAEPDGLPPGVPDYESSHREGVELNSINEDLWQNTSISVPMLTALHDDDVTLKEIPDYKFYINYDFYNISNTNFFVPGLYEFNKDLPKFRRMTPQLNRISMKLQDFPLLPERNKITPDMFCNETSVKNKNCEQEFCQCTHVLQVPLGSVVELVLVDKAEAFNTNHPFHLHGYAFRVIGMERLGSSVSLDYIKELDEAGLLQRKLKKAPYKDTVNVPAGGYTIIRFLADNPGYWLFHCHIDFHVSFGMAIVFKVGENKDMPPVPNNFPTCGSWKLEQHT